MTAPRPSNPNMLCRNRRAPAPGPLGVILLVAPVWFAGIQGVEAQGVRAQDATAKSSSQVTVARKATGEDIPTLPDPPRAVSDPTKVDSLQKAAYPDEGAPSISLPPEHHPWARFAPGAWRTLRTVTETFDPTGKFIGRSESTQTETLVDATTDEYVMETTAVVHVGGKELRGAAQEATLSLLTDSTAKQIEATPLPEANLNLEGRILACQRWKLVVGAGPGRRVETVYYSPDLSPYILRREVSSIAERPTESDAESPTLQSAQIQSTTAVVRADTPVAFEEPGGGEEAQTIVPGAHITVESQAGSHRITQFEVHSDVVPGGLVSSNSTERDASGRRVRWSTTELIDYGQAGDSPRQKRRWRLFRRRSE